MRHLLQQWITRLMPREGQILPTTEMEACGILAKFAQGQKTDVTVLRRACQLTGNNIQDVIRMHNQALAEVLNLRRSA